MLNGTGNNMHIGTCPSTIPRRPVDEGRRVGRASAKPQTNKGYVQYLGEDTLVMKRHVTDVVTMVSAVRDVEEPTSSSPR